MARLQRPLIMLLDVECYQGWGQGGCMMAPDIPAILHILQSGTGSRGIECLCLWTLKDSVREAPVGALLSRALLTVPWHCCLSRKTSVGATARLWTEAVRSAAGMELEKIGPHPARSLCSQSRPEPVGLSIVKEKGQARRPG